MKLISVLMVSVGLWLVAPAPSHAASVGTEFLFVTTSGSPNGEAAFAVLTSEDPRCEHGRVVRLETRANSAADWQVLGQEATKQTATAAFGFDPDELKSNQRFNVLAKTLPDGTVCKAKALPYSAPTRMEPAGLSARGGGSSLEPMGFEELDDGSAIFAAVITGPRKCASRRLVIYSTPTLGGDIELARDTTDPNGLVGVDFPLPPNSIVVNAPKRKLKDGTVCPLLTVI